MAPRFGLSAPVKPLKGQILVTERAERVLPMPITTIRQTVEGSIMLGDSIEVDIQGAINAGIDQVYINHLGVEPAIKPTYTVNSLKELEEIF